VAHDNARIWTATSSSSIYQWPDIPPRVSRSTELAAAIVPANLLKMNLNESSFTESAPEQYYPTSTVYSAASLGSIYVNSRGDKQSQHSSEDDEGLIAPIFEDPENVIQGEHGLIKHTVLNNRRMVVTEDKCGEIALWDLIKVQNITHKKKYIETPPKTMIKIRLIFVFLRLFRTI
jgi:WD repeat-containing protein 48